jgi:hypothetical protein
MIFLTYHNHADTKTKQQVNIKFFCVMPLKHSFLLHEVYGENTLSEAHMFQRHKKFSETTDAVEGET